MKTKNKSFLVLLIGILLVFSLINLLGTNQNADLLKKPTKNDVIKISNEPPQVYIEPPEELITNITMIDYNKGINITGDLDSLKKKDGENLVLTPEVYGVDCYYNISFYFGWETDTNFTKNSDMSYNIFLWLDFEVDITTNYIGFKRLYFENETYYEADISETIISHGYINLTKHYYANTIGFRICENWIGYTKMIRIDRMSIVKMHSGTLYPDVCNIVDYQLNKLQLDKEKQKDFSQDYKWWANWTSGQIRVDSDEYSPSARETRNIINISLFLPKGIYNIKRVNEFKLGYFATGVWIGTPVGCDDAGYWLDTYLSNFSSNKEQLIEEKFYECDIHKYKLNNPYYEGQWWWSNTNITDNFKELIQGNLADFFNYNQSREQYYWDFKLDGYAHTYPDDEYWVGIYHYLRYAYVNVTVEGYGFTNGYCNYPESKTTFKGTKDYSFLDGRIYPLDLFTVRSNISARCRNNTITSSECRIKGSSYDSNWIPMSYNDIFKQWETATIDASGLRPEGYYDVWIKSTDNEGLTTYNVTTLLIYNSRAESDFINPNESASKLDFRLLNQIQVYINISDVEFDPIISKELCIYDSDNPMNIIFPSTKMNQDLSHANQFYYNLTKKNVSLAVNNEMYTFCIYLEDERGYVNYTLDVQIILYDVSPIYPDSGNGKKSSKSEDNTYILISLVAISLISVAGGSIVGYALIKRHNRLKSIISKSKISITKSKGEKPGQIITKEKKVIMGEPNEVKVSESNTKNSKANEFK